jgi:hypothetical protein
MHHSSNYKSTAAAAATLAAAAGDAKRQGFKTAINSGLSYFEAEAAGELAHAIAWDKVEECETRAWMLRYYQE